MKEFIEKLYKNFAEEEKVSEEVKVLMEKEEDLYYAVGRAMKSEKQEILDSYVVAVNNRCREENKKSFEYGLKLGLKLVGLNWDKLNLK